MMNLMPNVRLRHRSSLEKLEGSTGKVLHFKGHHPFACRVSLPSAGVTETSFHFAIVFQNQCEALDFAGFSL